MFEDSYHRIADAIKIEVITLVSLHLVLDNRESIRGVSS